MNNSLRGQAAWITGGATGIGLAAARALGEAGARLFLSGRREAELASAVAGLEARGLRATAVPLDVADATAVASAASRIAGDAGRIDLLVCSAGTNVRNRGWDTLTAEAFAQVTAINLNGVAACVTAVLPGMRAVGAGTIVVVSSWAGWRYTGFTGAAYGASKTGLAPLVESINDQEGRHGIRATLVCPGEVATPILRSRPVPPSEAEMARMLQPDDVGAAVAWVATQPPHVCLNEIVISPVWNRIYVGGEDLVPRR